MKSKIERIPFNVLLGDGLVLQELLVDGVQRGTSGGVEEVGERVDHVDADAEVGLRQQLELVVLLQSGRLVGDESGIWAFKLNVLF